MAVDGLKSIAMIDTSGYLQYYNLQVVSESLNIRVYIFVRGLKLYIN